MSRALFSALRCAPFKIGAQGSSALAVATGVSVLAAAGVAGSTGSCVVAVSLSHASDDPASAIDSIQARTLEMAMAEGFVAFMRCGLYFASGRRVHPSE